MKDRIISYSGDEYGLRFQHNQTLLFLEMLDTHCRKNSIKYSLAYGTMLGCIRSHGFIPWDDDVDIVMMRPDYNRFMESIELHDTELSRKCCIYCPQYINKLKYEVNDGKQSFSIYTDLFAADIVPRNIIVKWSKYIAMLVLKTTLVGRTGKKNSLFRLTRKVLAYLISFPFSVEWLRHLFSKMALWGNNNPSEQFGCYYASHLSYGIYHDKEVFKSVKYMPFEDMELPVMEGYDKYLTKEFGDYMTPPPQKDRHATHTEGWN